MEDNYRKDKLLYIKDKLIEINNKAKYNSSRIDSIIKMINNVDLNNIKDIILEEDSRVIVILECKVVKLEQIIFNKITNTINNGFFTIGSDITFELYSSKGFMVHWLKYKVYKNNLKNTILFRSMDHSDIGIYNYINYIYNTLQDIKKELINIKISKKEVLDFIKYENLGKTGKIKYNKDMQTDIKLIDIFFNKNEFITKDNLYNFTQIPTLYNIGRMTYIEEFFNAFVNKLFSKII